MQAKVLLAAVALLLLLVWPATGSPAILRQADLKRQMASVRTNADACVRLLHAAGTVGCATQEPMQAPLRLASVGDAVPADSVLLVAARDRDALLRRLAGEQTLRTRVKGVLVDPEEPPAAESSAAKFPRSRYAPYRQPSYQWNPSGSDVASLALDLPVMLLDEDVAADARRRALANEQNGFAGAVHTAHLDSPMWAQHNSTSCLRQQTCYPLGGHSVLAAVPPAPAGQPGGSGRPVVMLLAGMDSTALFHGKVVGAESAAGSLIALLAAAAILGSNAALTQQWTKQVVLAALAGEPWDLMGSRRLLWEVESKQDSVQGLRLEDAEQIIELGQVGLARQPASRALAFHAHSERAGLGDSRPLLSALVQAAEGITGAKVTVAPASSATPGIPPSSLTSFLRVRPRTAGAVLADFDASFAGAFFESEQDTAGNIQPESLAAAAAVAAAAVHALAAAPGAPALQFDFAMINATVDQLIDCLLRPEPGLQCPAAQQLMASAPGEAVTHYISDLKTLTRDSQDPDPVAKGALERFAWQFLVNATAAAGAGGQACQFEANPCPAGQVCAGPQTGSTSGTCRSATVRYVPSYSTRLACEGCHGDASSFRWNITGAADAWNQLHGWPPDPLWVESVWPFLQPSYRIFQAQSAKEGIIALVIGLTITVGSIAGVATSKIMYSRHLKSQ